MYMYFLDPTCIDWFYRWATSHDQLNSQTSQQRAKNTRELYRKMMSPLHHPIYQHTLYMHMLATCTCTYMYHTLALELYDYHYRQIQMWGSAALPGDSSIVQSLLSIKLDPESSLEVIFVLACHHCSVRVLKQISPLHGNLKHSRQITLKEYK